MGPDQVRTRTEEEVLADHMGEALESTGIAIWREEADGKMTLIETRTPDGLETLHRPGVKDDGAKLPVELVPTEMIEAVAEIMDFGRQKYTEDGWKSVPNAYRRYMGALLRHAYAILRGELIDPESGKPHVFHLACNVAFLCYFHKRGIACRPFEPK